LLTSLPSRRTRVLAAVASCYALAASLVGCNTHNPVLADLFIPLPPAAPVTNAPRHPPPPKRQRIVIVQEEVVKPPEIDYAAIYQTLPRDKKGVVDWMRSLSENLITPKPGIDPAAEPAKVKEGDIEFVNAAESGKAATFRHATHTQWLTCKNCHNSIFKKSEDNLQFTHDEMEKGKYCGACHFSVVVVQSGCKGCHAGKKPAVPAAAS
jgi:c(7)-type cytochrome triheme protein